MFKFWWLGFFLLIVLYSVWSYSLTDPNLIISNWEPYWNWQKWMWSTFFLHADLLTRTFVVLGSGLFVGYGLLLRHLAQHPKPVQSHHRWWWLLVIIPLFVSYNALSHDVFNYLFNAKMVAIYEANPHVKVALEFPLDDWLRFMHNTHTPAPYGYGWTLISVLPFLAGMGKFLSSWLLFRAMSILSLGGLYWALQLAAKKLHRPLTTWSLGVLFLNPLLLIEIISNSHNDIWMMAPAVAALGLVGPLSASSRAGSWWRVGLSGVLLAFSISIKFSTLALTPLWLLLLISQLPLTQFTKRLLRQEWLTSNWPFLASLLLFPLLVLSRSQQFHPWYLLWVLVWIPLFNHRSRWQNWWRTWLLALSVSSFFRYVPWLLAGGFEGNVFYQQKLVTWVGGGIALVVILGLQKFFSSLKGKAAL